MKHRIITSLALILCAVACQREVEPQCVVGYIIDTHNSNQIILNLPDSIPSRRSYIVNDDTAFSGGGIIEGNVAEVVYLPSEDEESLPIAQSVVADVTYPRIVGRWRTDREDALQVDLHLKPHGEIEQIAPDGTLVFDSWQLTGEENEITLHGSLSLPPVKEKRDKTEKKDTEDAQEPSVSVRREKRFSVVARLAYDEEGNTEQHKVLIVTNDKGRESRLYPAWE